VVPRAWTIAFAEMSDAELPDQLPEAWIEQAEFEIRSAVPTTFTEPSMGTGDGDDGARAVAAQVRAMVGLEGSA
jgi:hypothetical protein